MMGHWHIRTIAAGFMLALANAVSPGPAQAQGIDGLTVVQPMMCEYSSRLGRFLTTDEIENPQSVYTVQQFMPDVLRGGLAYFEVEDLKGASDGSQWIVLQHCPSGQNLEVQLGANGEAVRSRLWDLLAAVEDYTMSEAAGILSQMGASATVTRTDLGTCACEHQRFYYGTGN